MATVVQRLAAFDDKAVIYEVDISTTDNLTGNVTALRCIQNGVADSYGEIMLTDGSRKQTNAGLAGSGSTSVVVPTGAAQRITATFNAQHSRWTGFRGNFQGPEHPAALKAAGRASAPVMVTKTYE